MSWKSAKSAGQPHLERILERLAQTHSRRCRLAVYEDEDCYRFIKSGDEWTFTFHNMVVRAIERELRKRGVQVELITIEMVDYFDWIAQNDLQNSTENRARFIAEKTLFESKTKEQ